MTQPHAQALLARGGSLPPEGPPGPVLLDSWGRCVAAGLDPHARLQVPVVEAADLRQRREHSAVVRQLAQAELETLSRQIAGSNFLLAFADREGVILDLYADNRFAMSGDNAGIVAGSCWTEALCGTNGLGTALATGAPAAVMGLEHFFVSLGDVSCIAAPVRDARGQIVGVLDASSYVESRQRHTQALVQMAATQIENGLLLHQMRRHWVLAVHPRAEFLGTLSVGLLAFDEAGRLQALNARAADLLQGLDPRSGTAFDALFGEHFERVLGRLQHEGEQRLHDAYGSSLVVTCRSRPSRVALPPPRSLGGLRQPASGAGHEVVTALDRFSSGAASIQDRLRLWQGAWTLFLAHPLWGGGWGSFALGFFDQAATLFPDGGYKLYNNAHNIVLHLLAETGIAGPACLVLPAVLAWRGRGEVRDSHVLLFAAGVATVLLLHSLLEYPLWYAYFLAPAALVCGVLPLGVCRLSMARLWRLLAGTLLLGSSINLVVLWRDYRLFESVFWMRAAPERREELAGIMVRLHRNPLLRHYVEMAYTLPMRLNESELTGQLYANSRAMRFVPLDTLVYRQVLLLALADRGDEAVALLARARAAWPVPPEEYRTDLKRLSSSQPARFAPLLESASRRTPAQP